MCSPFGVNCTSEIEEIISEKKDVSAGSSWSSNTGKKRAY
jgi:hypothetical protein